MTREASQVTQHPPLTPFQLFISSRFVTGTGMVLSKLAPRFMGYAVADLVAGLIARFKPDVYWTLYANLRHVVSPETREKTVHRLARRVFRNNARTNYDLWHLVSRGPRAIERIVQLPPDLWVVIERARQEKRGLILAGAHTCGLDLTLIALAHRGVTCQVLGLADPPAGGFDLMDELRTKAGVRLTSIDLPSLREAIRRLRAGGVVATGVDRPVGSEKPMVEFFGQPACLPIGHVRLALHTDAILMVGSAYRDRGRIKARLSPPLDVIRTGDHEEDMRINLRRVTGWLETFIRRQPDQWALFWPVWPDPSPSGDDDQRLPHCDGVRAIDPVQRR